ncbi:MAG: hypothetical protein HYX63_03305 [Gammaproteobacteria bacterium]|nr:hypothetical protein [Gammaproteobacteria bacterium]
MKPTAQSRVKRAKVQSQSLANRLAGVSVLGFGASWKAPEPERVVVRDVITALEDRRALYSKAVWEEPAHVIQSILKIRDELTEGLKRIGDKSPAKDAFRIMRATCRDFLTLTSTKAFAGARGMMDRGGMWEQEEFFTELGKLRAVFGQQLAVLGYLYGIEIEKDLASILPPESKAEADEK